MENNYAQMSPSQVRALIREGKIAQPTTGMCDGYAQGNLVVLPKELAWDFLLFCQRNPKSCPLLEVADAGSRTFPVFGAGSDIARDIPKYRVYENGVMTGEYTDVSKFFDEPGRELVSFLIGCSFSFESALLEAGGSLILVPAVTGEQACARDNEAAALRENRLLLVCETLPDAPFSAAKALARNHTIYALGEAAIVVAARKGVGGSWRGATAALCGGFAPVYVPDGNGADFAGNRALFEYGAQKIDLSGQKTIAEQIAANQQMTLFDGIKGDA